MRYVENHVLEHAGAFERPEGQIDQSVLKRAELLPAADRLMIELLVRGTSRRRIADILKLEPGTVSRRIQRLSRRLHDPIVIALLEPLCPLPPEHRQIGVEHFLVGMSGRQLAEKHAISVPQVRRMIDYVRGWHRGLMGAHRRALQEMS